MSDLIGWALWEKVGLSLSLGNLAVLLSELQGLAAWGG